MAALAAANDSHDFESAYSPGCEYLDLTAVDICFSAECIVCAVWRGELRYVAEMIERYPAHETLFIHRRFLFAIYARLCMQHILQRHPGAATAAAAPASDAQTHEPAANARMLRESWRIVSLLSTLLSAESGWCNAIIADTDAADATVNRSLAARYRLHAYESVTRSLSYAIQDVVLIVCLAFLCYAALLQLLKLLFGDVWPAMPSSDSARVLSADSSVVAALRALCTNYLSAAASAAKLFHISTPFTERLARVSALTKLLASAAPASATAQASAAAGSPARAASAVSP
jgi:hypothetical protein